MADIREFLQLEVLDPPDIEQTQFGPDMNRWLSNVVDIINADFSILDDSFNNLISATGIDIGGGGAGPIIVPVIGLTPQGFVNVSLISTTNTGVSILDVTPGTNSFSVSFTSDPGASAIIVYQAFMKQPQGI